MQLVVQPESASAGNAVLPKDHNFFSGDAIYYTPQKADDGTVSSFLFAEGLYFIERVNQFDIRLAKSRSNLYDGNYQKVSEATVTTDIVNNTLSISDCERFDIGMKAVNFLCRVNYTQKIL